MIGGAIARKDRQLLLGRGPIGLFLPWLGLLYFGLGVACTILMFVHGWGPGSGWPALGALARMEYLVAGMSCLVLVMAFVPMLALEATLMDLEDDRLELIALTPISASRFVLDKLRVALGFPGVIFLAVAPILFPPLAAGGLTLEAFFWEFSLVFLSAALAGAFAILVAAAARQALVARLVTLFAIVFLTLLPGSGPAVRPVTWIDWWRASPWRLVGAHFLDPSRSLATSSDRWIWTAHVCILTVATLAIATFLVRRALLVAASEGGQVKRPQSAQALLGLAGAIAVVDLLARHETGPATMAVFAAALLWGLLGPVVAARRRLHAGPGDDPIEWKDRQLYRSGSPQVILGALFLGDVAWCAWNAGRHAFAGTPSIEVGAFVQSELVVLFLAAILFGATSLAWERLAGTFDLVLLSGLDMARVARSKVRAILLGLAPVWVFCLAWGLARAFETRHDADPASLAGIACSSLLALLPLFVLTWIGCAYGLAAKNMGEVAASFSGTIWFFIQFWQWLVSAGTASWTQAIFSPSYFPRRLAEGGAWEPRIWIQFGLWLSVWGFLGWLVPRTVLRAAKRLDPWGQEKKAQPPKGGK